MREKAILVGVETTTNQEKFNDSMEELKNLTETANGEVVAVLTQKRQSFDQKTMIGKGKIAELVQLIDAHEAELVIFNQELSPRQAQTIEEYTNVRVLDRVQLILDIFALRARSKEGKLQVELAQLNYLLPRLLGQGSQLSRLGGGIGTRGPGETKLETDRRHIRHKIILIKKALKEVTQHRERSRQKRNHSAIFRIGLIGYTNAGKSTLLNQLTQTDSYAEDQLFATLDPLTKKWELAEGMEATITDTVGFIQDLPTQLIESFHSTIEESKDVDLLLHVVDASAVNRHQQEKTVTELMDQLSMNQLPLLTVYNKKDRLDTEFFTPTLFPYVLISAKNKQDVQKIVQAIKQQIMEILEPYDRWLEADQSPLLYQLKKQTLLISSEYDETKNGYQVKGFARQQFLMSKKLT